MLNPKQRRFVAEYLKDQNGTQAAIRAGYSKHTARSQAHDLLTKPDIKDAIDDKLAKVEDKCGVTVEYVLKGLMEVAERCMQATPVMAKEGNKLVKTGEYEFDSAGANRALELLGKYKKMFIDKVEHGVSESLERLLAESR